MPLRYQQLSSAVSGCESAMCALPCIETMSTLATKPLATLQDAK
jgi:hypothetical protein